MTAWPGDPPAFIANKRVTAGGVWNDTDPYALNPNIVNAIKALKDLLEGVESHGMDYLFKPGATWDFEVQLGDAAGARKVIVRDSGGVEVAAIDSDGNITLSGTIDGVDLAAHVLNANAHHAAVTLGGGSDAALALAGQQLTLADVLTPAEHTAIGDGAPHHVKYTDAEAIAAVEGEATLDLTGEVTIAGWVGIGIASPDNLLHIWKASAGPTSVADPNGILVLENTQAYLQFLVPADQESGLFFGFEGKSPWAYSLSMFGPSHVTLPNTLRVMMDSIARLYYSPNIFAFQEATTISTPVNTNLTLSNSGTGDIILIPGGNVGIGAAAPEAKLDIPTNSSAINWPLLLQNNYNDVTPGWGVGIKFHSAEVPSSEPNKWAGIANRTSGGWGTIENLAFFVTVHGGTTAPTEKMTLTGDGKVGIGTTDPKSPLHVVGLPVYANNAAAVAGGLTAGAFYRTNADPDPVCVVH